MMPKALKLLCCILLTSLTLKPAQAKIIAFTRQANAVLFKLDAGMMKIRICKADLIQVKYTILDSFAPEHSLVVNNAFSTKVNFDIADKGGNIILTTAKLVMRINRQTNAITYLTPAGKLITAEAGKAMKAQTVAGIATYSCASQFTSAKDEGLYGLGCHPLDTLSINYKGRNQDMAIQYLTGAIPVLLSTKGYGLLWDNYSASNFYGAEAGNTQFKYTSESGKEVDYYLMYGPDFDHIISLYRTATGKAPMFAKWAYGLFQSQDRYMSQQEIIDVKNNYRNNHIPVDAIVQDWYYWDPLPIGSHVMKPERYPSPKAMVDELHKANIHAMISIWPVFGKGTANFDALKNMGGLTGITWDNVVTHTFDTYYDAHNPKARELYWQQARDSLIKRYGWDAWWVDQCEPDNGALLDERRKANFFPGKGIDYFNTYSLEHTKGLYSGWRKDIPNKRAFFLVRQAFAGQQRNATTLWSSDITCTFASLKSQVPQAINTSAAGIPYWTSDIGGYHYKWKAPDWSRPENQELFTRWFEFGVFCPIFRIHGKGERALYSKNWSDETKVTLLNYDKLRYRLLPYIYSLAGRVTLDDYTLMRSLAFDFRNDEKVYNIPDEYMFGPAFLVCPVTGLGQRKRDVYLPKQSEWYNAWTGEVYKGGQTISAEAPLNKIPLYIKAGSIVPVGPDMEYATQKPADNIELRIYTGANGDFTFYEDENDNYNYEKGKYTRFTLSWNDDMHELSISDTKGVFTGMLKQRVFKVVLIGKKQAFGISETAKSTQEIVYRGKAIKVMLK